MKTAKEILDEVTKGCGIVSEPYIIKAMERYVEYRFNELNKSDVIKSVCVHHFEDKFYLENGYVETCTKCGIKR